MSAVMSGSFVVMDDFGEHKVPYDATELSFWGINLGYIPCELRSCAKLRTLDMSATGIRVLRCLEELSLESLKVDGCNLSFIAGLPRTLRVLSATYNRVVAVRLPKDLECAYLSSNLLEKVPRGPALRELHVGNNPISFLEGFSSRLVDLEVSLNSARAVSLPDSLEVLRLTGSRGTDELHRELLAELPAGLREIRYAESCDYRLPVDEVIRSGAWRAPLERVQEQDLSFFPFEEYTTERSGTYTTERSGTYTTERSGTYTTERSGTYTTERSAEQSLKK